MKTKIEELTEEQKKEIEKDPLYFVIQGGSDGTFGNVNFHNDYSNWLPGASDYAAQLCKEQGIEW